MSSYVGLKLLSEALKEEYGYGINPQKKSGNESSRRVVEKNNSGADFCDGLKLGISFDKIPALMTFFEDFYNCSHEIDNIDAAQYIKKAEKYKKSLIES